MAGSLVLSDSDDELSDAVYESILLGEGESSDEEVPGLFEDSSDEESSDDDEKAAPPLKRRARGKQPAVKRRVRGKQPPAPEDTPSGVKAESLGLPAQVTRTPSDVKAESLGLLPIYFRRMLALMVPGWLFTIIWHIRHMDINSHESIDAIEFYAGRRTIQRAFVVHEGMRAAAFDKSYADEAQSFTTDIGFLHSVVLALRLRARGLSFWATVCSTWVFMSRSSTGRDETCPLGSARFQCVQDANLMVARFALLVRMLAAKSCAFGLEQPATSLMAKHPRVVQLSKVRAELLNGEWTQVQTYMAAFGTPIHKPTLLFGSGAWIRGLVRPLPAGFIKTVDVSKKELNRHGVVGVTGISDKLKESQGYTDVFGREVCKHYLKCKRKAHEYDFSDADVPDAKLCSDAWMDAAPLGALKILGEKRLRSVV